MIGIKTHAATAGLQVYTPLKLGCCTAPLQHLLERGCSAALVRVCVHLEGC